MLLWTASPMFFSSRITERTTQDSGVETGLVPGCCIGTGSKVGTDSNAQPHLRNHQRWRSLHGTWRRFAPCINFFFNISFTKDGFLETECHGRLITNMFQGNLGTSWGWKREVPSGIRKTKCGEWWFSEGPPSTCCP